MSIRIILKKIINNRDIIKIITGGKIGMTKRQLTAQIDESLLKELEKIRDETGLPLSRLIELRIKGYKIVKEDYDNK